MAVSGDVLLLPWPAGWEEWWEWEILDRLSTAGVPASENVSTGRDREEWWGIAEKVSGGMGGEDGGNHHTGGHVFVGSAEGVSRAL